MDHVDTGHFAHFNHARNICHHCYHTFVYNLPCVGLLPPALAGLTISFPVPTWIVDLPITQVPDPSLVGLLAYAHHEDPVLSV